MSPRPCEGKRVIASVIKWRVLKWKHAGLGWARNTVYVPFLTQQRWQTQEAQRGRLVATEAEITAMCPQPSRKRQEGFFSVVFGRRWPWQHLDFGLWTSETAKQKFLLFGVPQPVVFYLTAGHRATQLQSTTWTFVFQGPGSFCSPSQATGALKCKAGAMPQPL